MAEPEDTDRKYRAPALEKGLDVLELLAAHRTPLTLSQISSALDRSVSELFRMVQVLEFRGYVGPAPTGEGLVLTNKLFALGMTRAPAKDLSEAALPRMRQLSMAIGQSVHMAVASADQMVVVARIEAPGDLGFSVRVGYRRPLVAATSGLVLYAFQPEAIRAEWRARLKPAAGAESWSDFETRATTARKAGYVRADSAVARQITDLSAPIRDAESVVAALTVPYAETPTAIPIPDTVAAILAAAREISTELGGA
ncbi:MAG: IclR family transcriptional regulator [Alphaproteobacteria bacterium]|nr:IclR family transcriptional regulator [Alphaproteobacteria bacterium]